MPRNGSGSYTLPQSPFQPLTTISSTAVNSDFSDIAAALTQSVSADGQTPITGQLKSNVTATPAFSSSGDATTGFGVSAAGEADIFVGNVKIVAVTSTGEVVNGNLSVTGTTTVGTGNITTANLTTLNVSGILTDTNTGYWLPPQGTTLQRPGSPITGAERYNTNTNQIEYWNGAAWQQLAGIFAPNFQTFLSGSAATYTTPTAGGNLPLYLRVRMAGGGGGGGATSVNNGTNGGDTSFSNWTALHGVGGAHGNVGNGAQGGAGGTGGTNGTGTLIRRTAGQNGENSYDIETTAIVSGGQGGSSQFGGGGQGGTPGTTGAAAVTNTGSGGQGGGVTNFSGGGGGGAGEYAEFIITSPAASYLYTVGSGGNGGAAGTAAGGNGAAGRIEVEAFWQ